MLGESNSIINQKEILETYALQHGFSNCCHFSDNGISGTLFSRPGLAAMLDEVRIGNVSVVIIKDQSRIGRDVVEVGLLTRTFEEHNVRFIAFQGRAQRVVRRRYFTGLRTFICAECHCCETPAEPRLCAKVASVYV